MWRRWFIVTVKIRGILETVCDSGFLRAWPIWKSLLTPRYEIITGTYPTIFWVFCNLNSSKQCSNSARTVIRLFLGESIFIILSLEVWVWDPKPVFRLDTPLAFTGFVMKDKHSFRGFEKYLLREFWETLQLLLLNNYSPQQESTTKNFLEFLEIFGQLIENLN